MQELALINPENASENEVKKYSVREAARAVVIDGEGNIALLNVSKLNYFKLPGGGIDGNEDLLLALQRECREEIGCDIEIIGEIGSITEYRKIFKLKQISYCFFARQKGKKGRPKFMDDEIKEGFKEVWLSYEAAKKALKESRATTFEGHHYIVPRDIIFLEAAKKYITSYGLRR